MFNPLRCHKTFKMPKSEKMTIFVILYTKKYILRNPNFFVGGNRYVFLISLHKKNNNKGRASIRLSTCVNSTCKLLSNFGIKYLKGDERPNQPNLCPTALYI